MSEYHEKGTRGDFDTTYWYEFQYFNELPHDPHWTKWSHLTEWDIKNRPNAYTERVNIFNLSYPTAKKRVLYHTILVFPI